MRHVLALLFPESLQQTWSKQMAFNSDTNGSTPHTDYWKIATGYIIGVVVALYTLRSAYTLGSDETASTINVLICLTGGVVGWITGMVLTPQKEEAKDFAKWGQALAAFVSGALFSKIEPWLDAQTGDGALSQDFVVTTLLAG